MPGDMANANALVGAAAVSCTWACGNGLIQPWRNTSLVTNHLSAAGFYGVIPIPQKAMPPRLRRMRPPTVRGPMFVAYWNQYNATAGGQPSVHGVYTGRHSVKVLAEIDRKIDDGLPQTGSFRSAWPTAPPPAVAGNAWVIDNGRGDCAAASFLSRPEELKTGGLPGALPAPNQKRYVHRCDGRIVISKLSKDVAATRSGWDRAGTAGG